MRPVVRTATLLDILRENQRKHRAVFEAAVHGWYLQAQRELDAARERVLESRPRNVYVSLKAPQDHTSDYERVIRMVELHQQDTIELPEGDAAQYVQDDWGWKQQ